MHIVDAHADLLWQLWKMPEVERETCVEQTIETFRRGKVLLQVLPVFVPDDVPADKKWSVMQEMVMLAKHLLFVRDDVFPIFTRVDLDALISLATPDQITGMMLAIEGADPLAEETQMRLDWLYENGVRMLGMTWNHANEFGDGALADVYHGLSPRGKQLVSMCERKGIILDASHLSERSFWDLCQVAKKPFAVTHSNAASEYPHPRNLTDKQIQAVVKREGCIGINLIPFLLQAENVENVQQALNILGAHYRRFIQAGARSQIGWGSDFWGADHMVPGCSNPGEWQNWITKVQAEISITYSDLDELCSLNWLYFLRKNMP